MADHAEIVGVGPDPDGPGIHHALVNPRLPPPSGATCVPERSFDSTCVIDVGGPAGRSYERVERNFQAGF